jgi:uncharacterized protein YrrD
MNIKLGVPVVAENGNAGSVERIILHPDTHEVDAVVAVQGGMLTRDVVIPIDRILAADERGVRVQGTVEEISDLEPYAQSQYTVPPEDWIPPTGEPAAIYLFPASPYAVGAFTQPASQPDPADHEVEDLETGDVDVSGSTTVFCTDGASGKVDRVVTEGATDKVTHLVVQRGTLLSRAVLVPVENIGRMDQDGIYLTLTQEELDDLPTLEA